MKQDFLEEYSKPLRVEKTALAMVFWLHPRKKRVGRELVPVYDQRFPLAFSLKYAYYLRFFEKGNVAGNHYHKKKQELLVPLTGNFEVHLEDITTKKKEMIRLSSKENKAVYVRTGISHKIVSQQAMGILLVLASHPSREGDEVKYGV